MDLLVDRTIDAIIVWLTCVAVLASLLASLVRSPVLADLAESLRDLKEFWKSIWDEEFWKSILFLVILGGIFYLAYRVGISVVVGTLCLAYIFFYVLPLNIRKTLIIMISHLLAIFSLSMMNIYFGWRWNFPDIFGLVSGVFALALFLYDRYFSNVATSTER